MEGNAENSVGTITIPEGKVLKDFRFFCKKHGDITEASLVFTANYVNNTKEEAAAYAKYFLLDLIKNGDIPSSVIKDGVVDENVVKIAVHKLEPANMEKDVSDK